MTAMTALMVLLSTGQEPAPQTPATQTFTDPALGLSFTHPATWTRVALPPPAPEKGGRKPIIPNPFKKKGPPKKPDEGTVVFSIPGANGAAPAELTIVRASFSGAPEKWQQIQADANRNQKREVERQWQQEILGVPLLLTRIAYTKDGTATTTLTGLLYNAAAYKLLFRLSGPTATFDNAQYEFTQAMETLRTTDDSLPKAQEPDKPVAPPPGAATPDQKHTLFEKPKAKPKVAPVALNVAVGERKMLLRVPEGWTLEKFESDTATLRNPSVKSPLTIKLFPVSTSTRPTDALIAAANASFEEFKTVSLREDSPGTPNKAGNPMLAIWRKGVSASGPHAAVDAVVVAGDYYILVAGRPTPGDELESERKTIQALLDIVGLEPAP
jgi:hypothetical protein